MCRDRRAVGRGGGRRATVAWGRLAPRPGRCGRTWARSGGTSLWTHANRHYKAGWLRAFAPASGVLRCVGTLDGAPCPHSGAVDLRAGAGGDGSWSEREVGEALERLHLDHERPLHETCHRWRAALPSCGAPRSWDDGLDGAALCHDLFGVCACASGVNGEACVRFRCGPPRDAEDGTRVLQFVDHAYCHRS